MSVLLLGDAAALRRPLRLSRHILLVIWMSDVCAFYGSGLANVNADADAEVLRQNHWNSMSVTALGVVSVFWIFGVVQ